MFKALGAIESIFFRGVGPGGYDIYGVKFVNGFAELRLLLGADGKAEDVCLQAGRQRRARRGGRLFRRAGFEVPG